MVKTPIRNLIMFLLLQSPQRQPGRGTLYLDESGELYAFLAVISSLSRSYCADFLRRWAWTGEWSFVSVASLPLILKWLGTHFYMMQQPVVQAFCGMPVPPRQAFRASTSQQVVPRLVLRMGTYAVCLVKISSRNWKLGELIAKSWPSMSKKFFGDRFARLPHNLD